MGGRAVHPEAIFMGTIDGKKNYFCPICGLQFDEEVMKKKPTTPFKKEGEAT
jgi:hypothetical protein